MKRRGKEKRGGRERGIRYEMKSEKEEKGKEKRKENGNK